MPPGRFGDHFYGNPGWAMLGGALSTILWLAVLGVIVWAAMRYFQRTQASAPPLAPPPPSALELLRQRYVLGEIDLETFETMSRHVMASEEFERSGQLWQPWEAAETTRPDNPAGYA